MSKLTIVAELSANIASGGLADALKTVEAAAAAGADAIKLQTWTPGSMVLDQSYTIRQGAWKGRNLAELYREAQTPWEWHRPIFERAAALGMEAWSTPFDINALHFLESIGCPRYKIASFEILDLGLIKACAATGKPIIISTGMANFREIEDAALAVGNNPLTLLKCTSAYPAQAEEANLRTMHALAWSFNCGIGLSDHTMGTAVAVVATALGADMIEKHFILDVELGGPDAHFSADPEQFSTLVRDCRAAAQAIGSVQYGPSPGESTELRRGIYWARDLPAGHVITEHDMVTARPETSVSPGLARSRIGSKLRIAVTRGQKITIGAL